MQASYADEAGLSACKECRPGERAVSAEGEHDSSSPHTQCAVCSWVGDRRS